MKMCCCPGAVINAKLIEFISAFPFGSMKLKRYVSIQGNVCFLCSFWINWASISSQYQLAFVTLNLLIHHYYFNLHLDVAQTTITKAKGEGKYCNRRLRRMKVSVNRRLAWVMLHFTSISSPQSNMEIWKCTLHTHTVLKIERNIIFTMGENPSNLYVQ